MSKCRFMYHNLVDDPSALAVSSARPGAVGLPAPEALGSAVCHAVGSHIGAQDQVFVVEIDHEGDGGAVGSATFRWRRVSAQGWEASGVPTSATVTSLADGVGIKWAPGAGQDLYKGDRWSLLAVGRQGEQPLCDRDRDTRWRAIGCAAEWVQADLGAAAQVRALVLADHNFSAGAGAVLKGTDTPEPDEPVWSFDPAGGELRDSLGIPGQNTRATGRSYIDGGMLKYAAPGESCFEDGKLSIEPAATNLLSHSEQFDNAAWTKTQVTIAADETAAPDQQSTADLCREDAAGSGKEVFRYVTLDSDDTLYAFGVFAKGKGRDIRLQVKNRAGEYQQAFFDLAAGTVGTSNAAATGITALANGWHWCWIAVDSASGAVAPYVKLNLADGETLSYTGDGDSGLYLWGAQLEAGPVATAYIPTSSAPASRDADNVRWDLPQAVAGIAGGGAGTLVVRGFIPAAGQADMGYCRLVAPKTAEYFFYINPSGALVIHDGSSGTSVTPGFVAGLSYDLAARWSSSTGLMQAGYKLSSDAAWAWGSAAAYDGSFTLGDYLNIGYSPGYPFQAGDIEVHDSWLADPLEKSLRPWEHPDYSQAMSITSPHLVHFLDASHRHWRLELSDPGNPDGALAASLLYLGGYFEPERTFAAGFTRGTVAGRRLTTSDAGKVSGSATALATYYELSFPRLGPADADAFEAMMAAIHPHLPGGLRPLFFTPFSGQPEETLYCLPSSQLTRRRLAGGRWDLGLRLEEVVRTDA